MKLKEVFMTKEAVMILLVAALLGVGLIIFDISVLDLWTSPIMNLLAWAVIGGLFISDFKDDFYKIGLEKSNVYKLLISIFAIAASVSTIVTRYEYIKYGYSLLELSPVMVGVFVTTSILVCLIIRIIISLKRKVR